MRLAVALILMAFLLFSIGFEAILGVLQTVDFFPGLIVGIGLLSLFLLGGFNVWLILNSLHPISFFTFLRTYSYSWAASLVTPGQAGDASIILFMKKHGIGVRATSVAYLVDKLMTLLVFTVIAWYGCYYLIPDLKWVWFLLVAGAFLVLPCFIILLQVSVLKIKLLHRIQQGIEAVFNDLFQLRSKWYLLIINGVVTIIKWVVVSCVFWMAFRCFNITVNWPYIGVIPILSTLIGYIPVSIAGIGTVELSAVYLFGKVGVSMPVILSVYILLRIFLFLLAGLLMIFFSKVNSNWDAI